MAETLKSFGHEEKISKKILIIGGGNIGYNLAKNIEDTLDTVRVKIVEKNKERAEFLASQLNNTIVINGDPDGGGGLFSGAQTLSRENFVFCIEAVANSNSYQAFAYSNRNNDFYSITNNNVKASQVDGVRTDTEGW